MNNLVYNLCPVCEGTKKLKYNTKKNYQIVEMETTCWACRGKGVIHYEQDIEFTDSVLEDIKKASQINLRG